MDGEAFRYVKVPADVMARAGIQPGDELDVSVLDVNAIVVVRATPSCCVCGRSEDVLLASFGDDPVRHICVMCTDAIVSKPLVFPS